jgi:carbon storage regulator CsrA
MLVLSRRPGEEIVIDGHIRITLVGIKGGQVRLGITAPRSVSVLRRELCDRCPAPEEPECVVQRWALTRP